MGNGIKYALAYFRSHHLRSIEHTGNGADSDMGGDCNLNDGRLDRENGGDSVHTREQPRNVLLKQAKYEIALKNMKLYGITMIQT
jgi:hypothetical protein